MQPGNIVGAIANEAGIDGKHIGRVVIRDDHSFVDLPAGMPKELLGELRKARVAGQKLEISRALKTHAAHVAPRARPASARTRGRGDTDGKSRMQIWVDADACPGVIKEILFRAADRARVPVTLVANQPMRIPSSAYLRFMQVGAGLDVADKRIVELLHAQDLVITADIPLAAAAIDKGAHALNPRGELYTKDNIRERLSMRNFMDELRGSGVVTGGPAVLNQRDRQAFANSLDSFLARHARAGAGQ